MWRRYRSHIIVPGNLGTRSYDDEDDDDDAHFASSPPPMSDLGAASSGIPPSQAPKDTTVNRTSAEVGIIIGALVALGIIAISIFLLYRIRSDMSVDHQAWWRRRRRTAADQTAIDIGDKISTQAVTSDDTSVSLGASDGKVNRSQQNLVPPADTHMKPSFLQKIQQVLSKEPKASVKASKVACDMESGNSPESWDDGATGKEDIRTSAEWIGRSIPAASISLHTRSSMALGGALAPTGSLETTGPGSDLGSVSRATTPPKPVPHSHAILRENPLPPLPAVGDPRRDTKFTWMTEEPDPVRHRSIISWVANIQKRQEKRMQQLQPPLRDHGEAPSVTEFTALPPIAIPSLDIPSGDAVGSFRFSDMTVDLDIQTPALQTATMAWPVYEAAGQVEVPSIPRSTTRGRKSRPGSAERAHRPEVEGEQYSQDERYPQEGQGDQCLQDHQYSQDEQYPQADQQQPAGTICPAGVLGINEK